MRFSIVVRLVAAVAIVAAVWHSGPQQAYACLCWRGTGDEGIQRLIEDRYPQVFDATIESIEPNRGGEDIEAKVHAVYRGNVARTISFRQMPSCFDPVVRDVGRRYIIALSEFEGEMRVGACESVEYRANTRATEYEARLARLYPARAPAPAAALPGDDDVPWPLWAAVAGGVVAAAGVVAYGVVRRRGA